MSETACSVSDACRMIADRTGDQQAAHRLREAGRELDRLTAALAAARAELATLKHAIDETEAAYPLDIWPDPGPADAGSTDTAYWTRRVELAAAHMARRTCQNIRAALDPPGDQT